MYNEQMAKVIKAMEGVETEEELTRVTTHEVVPALVRIIADLVITVDQLKQAVVIAKDGDN